MNEKIHSLIILFKDKEGCFGYAVLIKILYFHTFLKKEKELELEYNENTIH
jgi:hypothetical protein